MLNFKLQKENKQILKNIEKFSQKFLDIAYKYFSLRLDYSEEALKLSDYLISMVLKDRRQKSKIAEAIIGSYLGFAIITNLGGRWVYNNLSIRKIGKLKGKAYPYDVAKTRLAKGLNKSIFGYYSKAKIYFCHNSNIAVDKEKYQNYLKTLRKEGWDKRLLLRILNKKEKPYIREESAIILGNIADNSILDLVLEALDDPEIAYYITIVLQYISDKRSIKTLMQFAKDKTNLSLATQAILALGNLKDKATNEVIDLLVDILKGDDEVLAYYASDSLGRIGGDYTVSKLLEILSGKEKGHIIYTIEAIEMLKDKRAIPFLMQLANSENDDIKEAAIRAFQYIPCQDAVPLLLKCLKNGNTKIKQLSLYALAFLGDSTVIDEIKPYMKDANKNVREHANFVINLLKEGQKPPAYTW